MAHYLIQASYTQGGITDLIKNPQDRAAAVRPVVERMGGKLEAFYYAFGDCDVVILAELPDNASMAALSMAVGAAVAVSTFKTTSLLTMDEAVEAMKKAGGTGYRPPGG